MSKYMLCLFISITIYTNSLADSLNNLKKKPTKLECYNSDNFSEEKIAISWLEKQDSNLSNIDLTMLDKNMIIDPSYYYYINPQKIPLAVKHLENTAFIKLNYKQAIYYNHHYKKELRLEPYLVRAVFSNFTGEFIIFDRGGNLLIYHSSLGSEDSKILFSPLIINLPKKPKSLMLKISKSL